MQACRLTASNFTNKYTYSQVFFNTILYPPCSPHVLTQAPSPYQILRAPPKWRGHINPCFQHLWETLLVLEDWNNWTVNVLLSTKILQGSDTASGTILKKSCSRICSLNPRLIYLNNILILKYLEILKIYMQVTEHFP